MFTAIYSLDLLVSTVDSIFSSYRRRAPHERALVRSKHEFEHCYISKSGSMIDYNSRKLVCIDCAKGDCLEEGLAGPCHDTRNFSYAPTEV